VREPRAVAIIRRPIAAGALDAFQHAEEHGILGEPSLQQAPLPQQGLVRRLDRGLAGVLVHICRQQALLDQMLDQRSGLGGDFGKPPTLILSIDQAEELFLAEAQDEAQPFLAVLRDLLTDDAPAIIAVFTIRSDKYEELQLARELDGLRQDTFSLPPMPKGSYAEVIKGPAHRLDGTARSLEIGDSLVNALLTDIEAGGAKDALPLLAFTLERLYGEYHSGGSLKLAHYEALGRVKGSIEAAVERALKAADADPAIPRDRPARLALLRRGLIPWLAGIDPDTGAPRRRVARLPRRPGAKHARCDLIGQRLQERLELGAAGLDDSPQVGPRDRNLGRRKGGFERRQQTGLSGDRRPLRPDHRQRQKVPVVALQPWE
jgi:hypothetical protein